jgi:excisionase family DNA binding protein
MLIDEIPISNSGGKYSMLTVKEVAGILGIHQNTVRRWSDMGLLRSLRISQRGDRRYKYEDITSFLDGFNNESQ